MEGGEERESRREDRKGGGRRVILQTCYRSITTPQCTRDGCLPITLQALTQTTDGFHGAFYHGNWRALHHHAAC